MKKLICNNCGAELVVEEKYYRCNSCKSLFERDDYNDVMNKIITILNDKEIEKYSNLKKDLWNELDKEYIDSKRISEICSNILLINSDDYIAKFYLEANKEKINNKELSKELDNFYSNADKCFYEKTLNFLLKSPNLITSESCIYITSMIEQFDRTSNEYKKYTDLLNKINKEINLGLYDAHITRDVFVAYSSKNEKEAIDLVKTLEKEGITCYLALRNMQHGSGAVDNYDNELKVAMDNSNIFLFASSKDSRDRNCDAYRVEINYIKAKESDTGIKKKKIEYVIEDYDNNDLSYVEKDIIKFFDGIERTYNVDAVVERIFKFDQDEQIINNKKNDESEVEVKYCINCGTPNDVISKNCVECGHDKFASTIQEAFKQKKSLNKNEKIIIQKEIDNEISKTNRENIIDLKNKAKEYFESKNYDKAFEICQRLKNQDDDEIQYYLGYMYDNGLGANQNYKKALEWYEKAADKGNNNALNEIGFIVKENKLMSFDQNIYIKKYGTDLKIPMSIKTIGYKAFNKCTSLTSITIPTNIKTIGNDAFENCTSLKRVNIISLESWCNIIFYSISSNPLYYAKHLYMNNKELTTISIPDSITSIKENTFINCLSTTSIILPDNITSINSCAFFNCSSLKSITISDSVTSIGFSAFMGCSSLTTINYCGTKFGWNLISKGSRWDYNIGTYTIYYSNDDI